MAELVYRSTFLEVLCEDEERFQDVRSSRAGSEPPLRLSRRNSGEAELQRYVRSLAGRMVGGTPDSLNGEGEEPKHQINQPPPESVVRVGSSNRNSGSLGHPVLCKRPCVHVAAGRRCEA